MWTVTNLVLLFTWSPISYMRCKSLIGTSIKRHGCCCVVQRNDLKGNDCQECRAISRWIIIAVTVSSYLARSSLWYILDDLQSFWIQEQLPYQQRRVFRPVSRDWTRFSLRQSVLFLAGSLWRGGVFLRGVRVVKGCGKVNGGEGCRHYVVIFLRARFIVAARDKFVNAPCTPPAAGNYCMNCNLSMMASLHCDASSTGHSYLGKVSTKIFNKVIIL